MDVESTTPSLNLGDLVTYMGDSYGSNSSNLTIENATRALLVPRRQRPMLCNLSQTDWQLRLTFSVILSLPVEILGIIGNLLAFIVLFKQKPITTTTVMLQCLAVADILVLVLSMMMRSMRTLHECFIPITPSVLYYKAYPYMILYVFPWVYVARILSTWLTVLLTIDRYIAVCKPLHAQRLCTLSRVAKELVILVTLAIIYNIPRFFEINYKMRHTDLNKNRVYVIFYKMVLFGIVVYIVPVCILAILNILLVRSLRKAEISRDQIRAPTKDSASMKRDITIVVAAVVFFFLICNIPAMISHIIFSVEMCFTETKAQLEPIRRHLVRVSNFLVILNSAINFIIYCIFSRNFRKSFGRLFCRRFQHVRRVSQGSTAKSGSTYFSLNSLKPMHHNGTSIDC